MGLLDQYDGIEWDEGNVWKSWEKHRVAPFETEQALRNEPFIDYDVVRYLDTEKRRIAMSRTDAGRLLFVVYTVRNNRIRPICTRDMHKRERKLYHEQTQTDPKIPE